MVVVGAYGLATAGNEAQGSGLQSSGFRVQGVGFRV